MKRYDFISAKKYIQAHAKNIKEVALGMKEDWFWTAETVYENDKFSIELDEEGINIAGITGSAWATPIMHIIYKDGTEAFKDCYTGESTHKKPAFFTLGVLSSPHQEQFNAAIEGKKI